MPETHLLDDLAFDYAYIARQITKWRRDRDKTAPPTQSLANAITEVRFSDSFIGSSILEVAVSDPGGEFLDFFDVDDNGRPDAIDLNFPPESEDAWWRMTQMDISQQTGMPIEYRLKFLERPAVYLMGRRGPVKQSRTRTRAQFFESLCKKVKAGGGIRFISAQLTKDQVTGARKVSSPGGGGKRMLYAGDSLAVGTGPLMKKKEHYEDTLVEASSGRTSAQTLAALTPRLNSNVGQVVFDAGTNDGTATGFAALLGSLYAATDNRDLVLVTVHGVSFADEMNSIMDSFANTHAYVSVADWHALASDHPEWLAADGIHAKSIGYSHRAELVHNALPAPVAMARAADPAETAPVGKPNQETDPSYPGGDPGAAEEVTNQPSEDENPTSNQNNRREKKNRGIRTDANLKIQRKKATAHQIKILNGILDVADRLNAGTTATEAMVVAAIGESSVNEKVINSIGYGGLFQGDVRASTHEWASDYLNYKRMAHYFLMGGRGFQGGGAKSQSKLHKGKSPGMIAADVEKSWPSSHLPTAAIAEHYYQQWIGEARAIIEAYGDGFDHGQTVTRAAYNFEIRAGESYWDGMNRLAGEVNWRLFVNNRTVFYDADTMLVRQVPAAYVKRTDPAVLSWDATWDGRRIATEMSLELICDPFEFRAGEVLVLQDFGILARGSTVDLPGRWLISEIERASGSVFSSLQLVQPEQPTPEPANDKKIVREEDDNDEPTEISKGSAIGQLRSDWQANEVIHRIVIPIIKQINKDAKKAKDITFFGHPLTVQGLIEKNSTHGSTTTGNRSDHQGPAAIQWACDCSNGSSPSPEMDALASALIKAFDLPDLADWHATAAKPPNPGNLVSDTHKGFRFQCIYRCYTDALGGNHMDHVHFGVRRVDGKAP